LGLWPPFFKFVQEVIAQNDTLRFSLFLWKDYAIWRVAEALEYGMVGINGMISTTVVPFGGVKEKVVWT
jgi:acyl-CoA reductase-like NAD-dependent aldehyde dehydrogenase